jgi:hypothetical protein
MWLCLDQVGFALAKLPEVRLRWPHREGRVTCTDPRYAAARFPHVEAGPLAHRLRELGRPFVIRGAGPTGRSWPARSRHTGAQLAGLVGIDPRRWAVPPALRPCGSLGR